MKLVDLLGDVALGVIVAVAFVSCVVFVQVSCAVVGAYILRSSHNFTSF